MPLSPEEEKQFATLTANFHVEDARPLKKMERKDKASSMSFFSFPSFFSLATLHTFLLCAGIMALCITVAGRVSGQEQVTLTAGGIGILIIFTAAAIPLTPKATETDTSVEETSL